MREILPKVKHDTADLQAYFEHSVN